MLCMVHVGWWWAVTYASVFLFLLLLFFPSRFLALSFVLMLSLFLSKRKKFRYLSQLLSRLILFYLLVQIIQPPLCSIFKYLCSELYLYKITKGSIGSLLQPQNNVMHCSQQDPHQIGPKSRSFISE
jgi:hypothetical protein